MLAPILCQYPFLLSFELCCNCLLLRNCPHPQSTSDSPPFNFHISPFNTHLHDLHQHTVFMKAPEDLLHRSLNLFPQFPPCHASCLPQLTKVLSGQKALLLGAGCWLLAAGCWLLVTDGRKCLTEVSVRPLYGM